MSTPSPYDLFDAIHAASVEKTRAYFDRGGSVRVTFDNGRTPLAETVSSIIQAGKENADDDDMFSASASAAPTLSNRQDLLCEVGCILLRHGAKYNERTGQTNRSVMISQVIMAQFPQIHSQWQALHQRNMIMGGVATTLDNKPAPEQVKRKM